MCNSHTGIYERHCSQCKRKASWIPTRPCKAQLGPWAAQRPSWSKSPAGEKGRPERDQLPGLRVTLGLSPLEEAESFPFESLGHPMRETRKSNRTCVGVTLHSLLPACQWNLSRNSFKARSVSLKFKAESVCLWSAISMKDPQHGAGWSVSASSVWLLRYNLHA